MPPQEKCDVCGEIVDPVILKYCKACRKPFCDQHYRFVGNDAYCDKCYFVALEKKDDNSTQSSLPRSVRVKSVAEVELKDSSSPTFKYLFILGIIAVLGVFIYFWLNSA